MTNQVQEQQTAPLTNNQKAMTTHLMGQLGALKDKGLRFPENYNPSNALESAYFALNEVKGQGGRLALEVCEPASVANALLDMTIQGLNPAKKQCYFIAYGSKLQMMRSYHGTQAVVLRMKNVQSIVSEVIWKGDEIELDFICGRQTLINHKKDWRNQTGNKDDIDGAYTIIFTTDGEQHLTIMTKAEIDKSWSKAKTKNVQNDFPQEMAKRTVINRACKAFMNTSDDSDLVVESFNRVTENEFDNEIKQAEVVKEEIAQEANSVDFIEEPTEFIEKETEDNPF